MTQATGFILPSFARVTCSPKTDPRAIGVGGLDVALAMAGQPYYFRMPEIIKVELNGKLRPGVSAKDIALEMLRRFSTRGGIGRIFEYVGNSYFSSYYSVIAFSLPFLQVRLCC